LKLAFKWPAGLPPLMFLALGLALGIAPRQALPPPLEAACLALGIFAFAAALAAWLRGGRQSCSALMLASGLALGAWRVQALAARLAGASEEYRQAVMIEATVAEDYGEREESGRRSLRLKDLAGWDGEVRLSMDAREGLAYGPGDRIRAYGSLRRTSEPMNPGEFDYRAFLLGRGITGLFSARKGLPPEILKPGSEWGFRRLAWRAWRALSQGLERRLSRRGADLARGMVLGDTGGLSAGDMSVYARTGLVHILSVSGLHLALALAIFLWIARRMGFSRRTLSWLALLGAFFYASVCGLPVPCQRALFLFGLALIAKALDLESDVVTSLAFGACVILVLQPGALFEAGAQLSFVVSLALVTLTRPLAARLPAAWPEWLTLLLAGTAAAEFATIPLVAWHFNMLCWPSLFASIATAPLMGPIVGLGLGCAALGAWLPLAGLLEWALKILDWMTAHFAALPYAAFSTGRPPWLWMLLWCVCGIALLRARRAWAWGLAMLALAFVLIWPGLPWAHRHPGLTRVWFFSVGQGDASLTEFGDGAELLVDAGPLRPDAGNWVVGPALRRLGVNRLDWAVVTHPHADHYGGMFWMLEQFKTGELAVSGQESGSRSWLALKRLAARKGIALRDLSRQAPPAAWAGRVGLLSPSSPPLRGTRHDMHNNGVVLNVEGWLLLTGDMQAEGEARLLKRGLLKPLALFKAGHHGSSTSSSPAFLKALGPAACVISCGVRNRYLHPSAPALEDLRGRPLYRTDLQGCIAVEHAAAETRIRPWKEAPDSALWAAPAKPPRFPWKSPPKPPEEAE
jgi:competence protein ComEC